MGKHQTPWTGLTTAGFLLRIAPDVIDYVEWYAQNGFYLPKEFNNDPSSWTQILRDIQIAFELLGKKKTAKEVELMHNGLGKYYKYSRYLWRQ